MGNKWDDNYTIKNIKGLVAFFFIIFILCTIFYILSEIGDN